MGKGRAGQSNEQSTHAKGRNVLTKSVSRTLLELREKAEREPKFSSRKVRRCQMCGRPRAVYRKFGICRICFRKLADQGLIPGVRKSSW